MPRLTSFSFFTLYFMWCVIAEGNDTEKGNLYISRSGDDTRTCTQAKPCKTIWRAVTLASHGDRIHLDGTNTNKDPYTCQSGTPEHPGIYINKSVSLMGSASPMPQIRCTEGTGLTFSGSDNEEQMNVTLSTLLVSESFFSVQDSSLAINGCKFLGSKQAVKITTRTSMVSSIRVTDSTFSRNSEGISVVVNISKSSSQCTQVMFKLINSYFEGNVMSNDETCISFTELPNHEGSVSCNITLENVTFSHNKFSSKGLVFLEVNNGDQHINLQNVTFTDNSPSSGRAPPLIGDGYSECIVRRSTSVNISINSSSFTSQYARSFGVSASNISFQIYNSSFCGHRVEGNGGVVYLEGTDFCKLFVSNSSFVNTTAARGGAFNIECASVESVSYQENNFTNNTATNGEGGAVYIYSPGSTINDPQNSTDNEAELDYDGQSAEHFPGINFTKCNFTNAGSFSGGGGVHIKVLKAFVQLHHSTFINCTSNCTSNYTSSSNTVGYGGGGVLITTNFTSPKRKPGIDLLLTVESSGFIGCRSACSVNQWSGSLNVLYKSQTNLSINNSHFISNDGGAISARNSTSNKKRISYVTIEHSTFLHNSGFATIFLWVYNQSIIKFKILTMESNRAHSGNYSSGGTVIGRNCTLSITQSRFLKNEASGMGGVFYLYNVRVLKLQHSYFDSNFATWRAWLYFGVGFGGALYVTSDSSFPTSIVIFNTTFNNCSAPLQGGAIYLSHDGNVSLEVKKSRFVKNFVSNKLAYGGAIHLLLAPDTKTNPGCITEGYDTARQSTDANEFPSWVYKSHVIFEDTIFEINAGSAGGAVYITNGEATFRNCHFIDNFAATEGGHIHIPVGAESTSLNIEGCVFNQTLNQLQVLTMSYNKASFIHAESSGALKLYNTTMDAKPYGSTGPFLLKRNGRLIDFGNNNSTTFNCPVGSQMEILSFTDQFTTQKNNTPCKIEVTTLEFSCSACAGNSYSLQRGRALGSQLAPGFHCLPCPFGANCSQNIFAKPNFWGSKEQLTPQKLKFTMCPLGYCRSPQKTDFPEYNGCQGNRSGKLCGHCKEAYTETLYSTNCRPSHECKDYWFWPVTLLYVSLMAFYFTFKPPIVPWIKRQILWFKNHDPPNEEDDFDRGYLKIVFYFYQAANLLLVSNSSQHIFKTAFVNILVGLFNFQQKFSSSGLICPFPGLTVVTKQIFSTSYVFGTCLMVCVFYCFYWGVRKYRGLGAPSVDPYIAAILQTMLLGYSTLASISFDLLRCVPIGAEKRLFYDGKVVCYQWWQNILIGFVCVFLFPFVFVLFWGCFKLYNRTLSVGKFLIACCFPLPSLLYWSFVFLFFRRRNADNEDSSALSNPASEDRPSSQRTSNSVERVLYDSFKRPEDGTKLSLSWESVMIGRRLIFILLKALINDPMPRLLIMIWFCVLFLQHHSMTQPFRDSFANLIETISLLSLVIVATVNMFFASFLSLAVPFNDYFSSWYNACQGVEIVILCAVPVVFLLLVVAVILSLICRTIFVVCLFFNNFCWICFSRCYSNKNEERRPLASGTGERC